MKHTPFTVLSCLPSLLEAGSSLSSVLAPFSVVLAALSPRPTDLFVLLFILQAFVEWHSGKSAVSFGKSFLWLFFVWALPRFCLVCCCLLTKRKSGWGICGSSWLLALCGFLVDFDLPAFMDQLCPCTNVFLTAYAHLRTEPQSDIGQARRKKKTGPRS